MGQLVADIPASFDVAEGDSGHTDVERESALNALGGHAQRYLLFSEFPQKQVEVAAPDLVQLTGDMLIGHVELLQR